MVNMDQLRLSTNPVCISSTHEGTEDYDYQPYVKRYLYPAGTLKVWNISKLARELGTKDQRIAFAESQNLLSTCKICRSHKVPVNLIRTDCGRIGAFKCFKKSCHSKSRISRASGTWFETVKISIIRVFYLMYCFAHCKPYDDVIWEDYDESENCISHATISEWYKYCRETIFIYQLNTEEKKSKIGGTGKIVQIDVHQIAQKKASKDCEVEENWILCMIEKGKEDLRLEVCPKNIHSTKILLPLMKKHVVEGSMLQSNFWIDYDCLAEHGYLEVNHSSANTSKVSDDLLTSKIQSQWQMLRSYFSEKSINESFSDIFLEYLWRKNIEKNKREPSLELINAVKNVYNKW